MTHAEPMKRCTKCREEKPATTEYFYSLRSTSLSSWCKECTRTQTIERAARLNPIPLDPLKRCAIAYAQSVRGSPQEADARKSLLEAVDAELREALKESVKLQSHYATLLNDYDGGRRMTFDVDGWLARLAQLKKPRAHSRDEVFNDVDDR